MLDVIPEDMFSPSSVDHLAPAGHSGSGLWTPSPASDPSRCPCELSLLTVEGLPAEACEQRHAGWWERQGEGLGLSSQDSDVSPLA